MDYVYARGTQQQVEAAKALTFDEARRMLERYISGGSFSLMRGV
jgi:hypothetical protein